MYVLKDLVSSLWEAPELLYNKFVSKDQTLILTMVLKGELELLRFSKDSSRKRGLPRTCQDVLRTS